VQAVVGQASASPSGFPMPYMNQLDGRRD